jgi:hypothetical protein
MNPLYQMSDIKWLVIGNLKRTKFMVIANRFLLFLVFFFGRKVSANDNALFGIGQAFKPYPTNMR